MKNTFNIITILMLTPYLLHAGSETKEVLTDSAKSAAIGLVTGFAAKKAITWANKPFAEKVGKLLSSPPGVGVMATVGTANAYILMDAAAAQEEDSKNNVAKVEAIMKTFQDSWIGKCPNGREKLEVPDCYCYMDDGTKNPNRTNSQTCQQLWSASSYKTIATADDYSNKSTNNPVGCLAVNGQFDQACQCKKMVDASGNNACMKTVGSTFGGTNPLGMGYLNKSGFPYVASTLDSFANGNGNLGSLNGRALANAIAKQGMMNNKLYKMAQEDPTKKGFPIFNTNAEVLKAQQGIFSPSDLAAVSSAIGGASSGFPEPTGALAEAINDAKKSSGLEMSGGQGLGKKVAKPSFNMDFGGPSASGGAVTQNFMDKNYNYKQDDIVKKPESSIFEVISNRYIESGLKRLFDEDK